MDINIQVESSLSPDAKPLKLKAYLQKPAGEGPFPALIVIHEITGLTDHIKDVTQKLAADGYVALAMDLFSAGNTAVCIWKCLAAVHTGETNHFGVDYLKSGLDYLSAQPFVDGQRMGAIGFCMGGNFAISLACQDKRIKTIAPFYGLTPKKVDVNELCPVVGSYPQNDLTASSGLRLKAALDKTDIDHDIKVYPGTVHCFMNDRIPMMHNQAAESDAWERTMAFFADHL